MFTYVFFLKFKKS